MTIESLACLSDRDLIAEVEGLAKSERLATARLIAALAELDARRLYLGEGCSSLFTYCTRVIGLSEHAAYGRIEAARAARRFPLIMDLLSDGSITLTTVGLLSPHLTPKNHREALATARGKSKRDVEQLVAHMAPRSDVPTVIRKLPAAKPPDTPREQPALAAMADDQLSSPSSSIASAAKRAPVATPLAPERYKVQFTASRETYDKLGGLRTSCGMPFPTGIRQSSSIAPSVLLAQLEKSKLGSTKRRISVSTTRGGIWHIPAAVRRAGAVRDGGQCAFVGTHGRCSERGFLEFHHLKPFAVGGSSLTDNIQLRCRAHNVHEANLYFGFGVNYENTPARCTSVADDGRCVRNSEPNRSLINHEPAGHLVVTYRQFALMSSLDPVFQQ